MGVLEGKVALVTGAGRGIGRAIAVRCAREGARVVVNDSGCSPSGTGLDSAVAEQVVAEIRAGGGEALADSHDVGKREDVEAMFAAALNQFDHIDILVTNAGIVRESMIADVTDDDWDAQHRTMLGGTFRCTQLFVRHFKGRKRPGRVLMVSSQFGLQGASHIAAYCATKGAINAFGLTAAQELAPLDITVNILSPMAYTRLTAGLPLMNFPNAEKLMSPEFCGDVATYLLSDAASKITGQIVHQQGAQISLFKISMTDGLSPENGERWSTKELAQRWGELIRQRS